MSKLIGEYSTRLKSFQYLAYLLLLISNIYLINGISLDDKQSLSEAISIGLLGIIGGSLLLYFGNKKRTLMIYDDKIEYLKPDVDFSAQWEDISLVKSFKELNRQTENLIIMKSDEQVLSISTAFFDRDKLVAAYNDIHNLLKNNENITFEDDRLWIK